MDLLLFLAYAVVLIVTNYIAFGYGVRIGKAMQSDIPPPPLEEPIKKIRFKLATGLGSKVYIQKKEPREELGMFD
jgi:hypothetical protein